jgi:hypothetical protein
LVYFRAGHLRRINPNLAIGNQISKGEWIGEIGNEGISDGSHLHVDLFTVSGGGFNPSDNRDESVDPSDLNQLCSDRVLDFRFDATIGDAGGDNVPPLAISNIDKTPTFLNFYPNPASNFIVVELISGEFEDATIQIFNSYGQLVLGSQIDRSHRYKIDIPQLARGLYIVRILQGESATYNRFIKH